MLDQSACFIGRAWAAAVRHGLDFDRTSCSVAFAGYQPPVERTLYQVVFMRRASWFEAAACTMACSSASSLLAQTSSTKVLWKYRHAARLVPWRFPYPYSLPRLLGLFREVYWARLGGRQSMMRRLHSQARQTTATAWRLTFRCSALSQPSLPNRRRAAAASAAKGCATSEEKSS
jgi:hypothetical protein